MRQLRHIVDSLHLRYKVCELRRAYRSHWQGQAHHVRLESGNIAAAAEALRHGISPEAFAMRFPAAKIERGLLVVSSQQEREQKNKKAVFTTYHTIPFDGQKEYSLEVAGVQQPPGPGQWVVEYEKKGYGGPYVEALYFPAGLTQTKLPQQYATLVQYADCLVDTTAQIYLEAAQRTGVRLQNKESASEAAFMRYVHQQTHRPTHNYNGRLSETEQEARWQAYRNWDSLRLTKVDAIAATPQFRELLRQAATDAASVGTSSDEFEEYVARYYSPRRALELKRSRRVIGGCSQDNGPRRHALGIAQLSAEAVNWETFLRAHLDIMNDRFERVSDGSYAWAARQTYLRELEELDINVPDLMLGISLRIDNPSQNHYFGTPYRVGRALTETRQPREMEQRLLTLVADSTLDTYNRVLAYYLFLNYIQHLDDKMQQQQNVAKLNKAVQTLPTYLVARATVKEPK
ncbi:hypothetical protein MUN84_04805 [Hymenobacter sp. 5516J-16]|uniref:hypothetical protein n=1 Tax=Hymenobacter sp. 5516J-16 TaxID=2932253 RepID=UPI001FD46D37|nr:hypothetical protein [Hymenobacter sp. 5516J-16]UOQ77959.1 hypothetical protein MUN84_04805 [Hymenobacter sp. 5516J-16]